MKHSISRQDPLWNTAVFAAFLFVLLQLITGLIEATYTFGLLGTEIPAEIAFALFLLSPLLLLIYPRILDGKAGLWLMRITVIVEMLSWAASLLLDTRGKMIFCGLGTGAGLLMLASLVRQSPSSIKAARFSGGLGFAGLLSIFLHAINSGNDVFWREGMGLLSILPIAGTFLWLRRKPVAEQPAPGSTGEAGAARRSFGYTAALCLGLFSAMILVYFGFATPTVIARWTGESYAWITALAAGSLALVLGAWLGLPRFRAMLTPRVLLAWNLVFALALALTLGANSIHFPCCPEAYPFNQPDVGLPAQIALVVMLVLHPVIYLDFGLLEKAVAESSPSPRALAGGFSLSAVYLMAMIFAQVFTTVYDYIPVIGPWFRDRFDLVTLFPAAVLVLAMFLCLPLKVNLSPSRLIEERPRYQPFIFSVILAAGAILSAAEPWGRINPAPEKNTLHVLTYNIQQGYSRSGQKNFDGQLNVIRSQDADIVGLEESDTARIAGGNADVVRYFANNLRMYSYYGPRTTTGTFGIALLSRYPIEDARTFFMYSKGEQTAAIQARVQVGEKTFTVLVTHLGNDGPIIQQQEVLERLKGQRDIIAMGDFNFDPSTEQYRLTTTTLEDGWAAAGTRWRFPGEDPDRRIDHIFLTPGTRVLNGQYLPAGPSDHPAMFVEIGW